MSGGQCAAGSAGEGEGAARERRRCERSFSYFLRHQVRIADGGGTKFEPWRWQVDLARRAPALRRLLVLKARQLGMSWFAAAYALWTALFQRGALVLLVSQTEDDAIELLAKAQFIFDELPGWLKPEEWKSNTRVLKFPAMHSAVVALPSTRRAGRGRTARLVIADEHSQHQWAEANFAALSPTVDAGGQFWILSTADGLGNCFADLCDRAAGRTPWVRPAVWAGDAEYRFGRRLREAAPDEGWLPVFLPYDARPGRDAAWWERKRESYPREWMIHQEYPRDPEEAFVQSGNPVFPKEVLQRHRELFRAPLPAEQWPGGLAGIGRDELRVFEAPKAGHRYVAGADVAEGLEHGDFSDLVVFDADHESGRLTEVLSLHGHWEPDVFAAHVDRIARLYPGLYGIERNNHGLAVLVTCRRIGTPGIHAERPVLSPTGQVVEPGRPGWLTTSITKPLMIDELAQALRTFGIGLSDELAYAELVRYQTNQDGSTGAPAGKHDDRVMSRAIAVQMRKHLSPRPSPPEGPAPGTFFGGLGKLEF